MFQLIKKMFMELLISLVNASNHTKWVSLSNHKCEVQPTFINLRQEFRYYPFTVKLDKRVGSCQMCLSGLSNKVCVPNKTKDLNLNVFNLITRIKELKTLTKHIPCKCKCRYHGRNYNSHQW